MANTIRDLAHEVRTSTDGVMSLVNSLTMTTEQLAPPAEPPADRTIRALWARRFWHPTRR
ncbi:hypothetical protein Athai_58910 [Actinocatenispora thailandica]|uniref:Uncharacterized protein n=1 Tax=Actinocatenispora thailandica TaxID=227318 RepID=A0A7R7HZL4_9ACTN|nr:hypothetical protein [Actinocatenispora thailandica]BCJ38388.1 hypothetical protein Athai_58910 [Actinocatenispora thailandica]